MEFKCPVDYKLDDCSSKEYGLTCDTCFHTKKDISSYMKEHAKISLFDYVSYGYIKGETKQRLDQIIDKVEETFSKEEIKNYIINNFNITTTEREDK